MQTLALRKYKISLRLNQTQISVLIGSILGDGTLRVPKGAINANYKVEQGLKQKDYVSGSIKCLKSGLWMMVA